MNKTDSFHLSHFKFERERIKKRNQIVRVCSDCISQSLLILLIRFFLLNFFLLCIFSLFLSVLNFNETNVFAIVAIRPTATDADAADAFAVVYFRKLVHDWHLNTHTKIRYILFFRAFNGTNEKQN